MLQGYNRRKAPEVPNQASEAFTNTRQRPGVAKSSWREPETNRPRELFFAADVLYQGATMTTVPQKTSPLAVHDAIVRSFLYSQRLAAFQSLRIVREPYSARPVRCDVQFRPTHPRFTRANINSTHFGRDNG